MNVYLAFGEVVEGGGRRLNVKLQNVVSCRLAAAVMLIVINEITIPRVRGLCEAA